MLVGYYTVVTQVRRLIVEYSGELQYIYIFSVIMLSLSNSQYIYKIMFRRIIYIIYIEREKQVKYNINGIPLSTLVRGGVHNLKGILLYILYTTNPQRLIIAGFRGCIMLSTYTIKRHLLYTYIYKFQCFYCYLAYF